MALKKLIFKDVKSKCTIKPIELSSKKGWQVANFTFYIPKNSKKSNKFRNLLIKEFKIKKLAFHRLK
jgi:hypothetical protein